jgi:hypothetical protein
MVEGDRDGLGIEADSPALIVSSGFAGLGNVDRLGQLPGVPGTAGSLREIRQDDFTMLQGDTQYLISPMPDSQLIRMKDLSVLALRAAVEDGNAVYLRAAALCSLIAIEGVEPLHPWLDELSRVAPVTVREVARRAMEGAAGDNPS